MSSKLLRYTGKIILCIIASSTILIRLHFFIPVGIYDKSISCVFGQNVFADATIALSQKEYKFKTKLSFLSERYVFIYKIKFLSEVN